MTAAGRTPQRPPRHDPATIDLFLRRAARSPVCSMADFKRWIAQAKTHDVWEPLGFKSGTAYVADVISKEMSELPIGERRDIVELLAAEEMSGPPNRRGRWGR